MRLAVKLVGALVVGITLLLAVDGALAVGTETALLEADMRRDARTIGQPLADLFGEIWVSAGEPRVRRLVERANAATDEIHLELAVRPQAAAEAGGRRSGSGSGRGVSTAEHWLAGLATEMGGDGGDVVTVLPIEADGAHVGALLLSESRSQLNRRARRAVTRTGVLVAVTAGMSGLLVLWLGLALIGRPLHRLAEKVRRIGDGDLTGPVRLRGRDELTELADGLNEMCDRLAEAQATVHREQMARVAALDQLRQADRLRTVGRLASEVAHELGTPLNVVSGRADLIASGELPSAQVVESAAIIKAQTRRMSSSIRQLLDFSRRQPPESEVLDVTELVREAFELLSPLAESRGVALEPKLGTTPARVEVARAPLQQVLANLVVNAVQAVDDDGRVWLETGTERRRRHVEPIGDLLDWAYVRVRDNGAGIAEDAMAHLFEPFFTTKGTGRGTGLGLSIAAGIVTEHGGWIDVESTEGEGSAFTVYLPRVTS